jgi:hypothetical protein
MEKINLPKNILEREQYKALSSSEKGEYTHNLIIKILKLNPDGITVSQVDKATYFGRPTIWQHLEILASRAQCLKVERGDVDVYYANKIINPLKGLDIQGKHYYYSFYFVENFYGKFVTIQIKQEGRSGALTSFGGVMIDQELICEVIDSLTKAKKSHLK